MLKRSLHWFASHRLEFAVAFLSIALLIVTALPQMLVTIDSGQTGVYWSRFFGGTEMEHSSNEGTAVKLPWDKIVIYNLRMQRAGSDYSSLTNNGLQVQVSVAFRFHVRKDVVTYLHKIIGPNYLDVLLLPEMGAHVRNVISQHSPEKLYSANRVKIQEAVLKSINTGLAVTHTDDKFQIRDYIFVDDVLVTNIILPEDIQEAIIDKESAKQLAFAYKHKLDIEEQEKQRKRIEAEGIRDFQSTITMGISDKYLKWEGIRATLNLATSNNSKVVIIGGGENGLPIILGQDYTTSTDLNSGAVPDTSLERLAAPQSQTYNPVPSPLDNNAGPKSLTYNPAPSASRRAKVDMPAKPSSDEAPGEKPAQATEN